MLDWLSVNSSFLSGIAVTLIMLLLAPRVAAGIKQRQETLSAFRRSFHYTLFNLKEKPDCSVAQIATQFHNTHLAAITEFRDSVPPWRRKGFDRAVSDYKIAADTACDFGSPFALAASEKTEIAHARREKYSSAIEKLISFV